MSLQKFCLTYLFHKDQCDLGVAGIDVLCVGVGGWVAGGLPRIRGCSSIVQSVEARNYLHDMGPQQNT